jgi:hypothetical protein
VSAAVGRDYDEAAPLHGVFVAAEPGETPEVEVVIRRLDASAMALVGADQQ